MLSLLRRTSCVPSYGRLPLTVVMADLLEDRLFLGVGEWLECPLCPRRSCRPEVRCIQVGWIGHSFACFHEGSQLGQVFGWQFSPVNLVMTDFLGDRLSLGVRRG